MNDINSTSEYRLNAFVVIYILILIGFILSQLPFLSADADLSIACGSRGAWTDEGLSTCQIRNYINHGHFNIMDSDNFIKTPLLSLLLYPFFKLLGISMVHARLVTVLFCSALLLVFLIRRMTLFIGLSFILTTMMFYSIFQYSHLCLAEMYSSMLIVTSAIVYSFYRPEKKNLSLFLLYIILILAVLFKIQFAYVLGIPILVTIINYIFERSPENRNQIIMACAGLGVIMVATTFFVYLPLQEEWGLVANQQSGAFSIKSITAGLILENVRYVFMSKKLFVFTGFFILAIFAAVYQLVKKQLPKEYLRLLCVSSSWFLGELHKLGMDYLPERYLMSTYVAMGFFIAIIMGYYLSQKKLIPKVVTLTGLVALFLLNSYNYKQAFFSRSYTVQKMNDYFKTITRAGDVAIGSWACTFSWDSKCSSYPIWTKFLGKRDIMNYYHPDFIVCEDTQEDSDLAYKINNVNLNEVGDLLLSDKVVLWNIEIYKVKK